MSASSLRGAKGITLHPVEDSGDQHADSLTFYKAHSRTIIVGRKSSHAATDIGPERALFRCQVVSRKHAQITFTEYGNVYITDLHSHHGTHVRRPGDFVSASLTPEQPTVLADGDLITFGKSVGRETCLVRPVAVRVELIFGGDVPTRALSPPPGFVAAEAPPPSQIPVPSHMESPKTRTRRSTGRYGVFLPSPESSPSSSDGDSDILEISPPSSPRASVPSLSLSRPPVFSNSSFPAGRLRLLQQILPPVRLDCSPAPEPEFSLLPFDAINFEVPNFFETPHAGSGAVEDEDMDLSSSRAPSPVASHSDNAVHEEPSIIGAWPGTPSRVSVSPERGFLTPPMPTRHEVIEISDDDSADSRASADTSGAVREDPEIEVIDVMHGEAESVTGESIHISIPSSGAVDDHAEVVELHDADTTLMFDMPAMQAQHVGPLNDVVDIHSTPTNDEAAFTAQVEETRSRLDALDAQVQVTQASIIAREDDLYGIQSRLQGLDSVVLNLQDRSMFAERFEDLMQEVGAAKHTLQETCVLQEKTRVQMTEELELVRALRAEAAVAVAEAKLTSVAIQSAAGSATLKRKRDDNEAEDQVASSNDHRDLPPPSPSKRRRTIRIVSAIAQTATVASLGAVAAWSALAFS